MPEIIGGPPPLKPGFEFLRQVNLPASYEIPRDLPVLKALGKLRQLSLAELNGLDSHMGTERIWKRLDPLYPVQVVPQLEISIGRKDVQFTKPEVRVYVHPLGYLITFRTELIVPLEEKGLTGFAMARVINSLERNATLNIAARAFKGRTGANILFQRIFACVSRQMFATPVRVLPPDDSFLVLELSGNDLQQDILELQNSKETRLELASALNRYTGNLPPEQYDPDKLGKLDLGKEAKSGAPSGWSFSAQNGFASYLRQGVDPQRSRRAALCHHRNVSKLIGFFRLYGSFLKSVHEARIQTVPGPVLQSVVDGYDRLAILFSWWWARWGTAVQHLDEPVRDVVQDYGLIRRQPHDRHATELGGSEGVAAPGRTASRVFISYSHRDAKWFKRLRVHLSPLERQLKDWCVWGDDKIKSGQVWRDQISTAMEEADVAVLLLSADFFASEFILNTELPFLLGKAQERQMSILSLVVSPFSENYAQRVLVFQGINSLDRPLLKMKTVDRETTFVSLADRLRELLATGVAAS